MVMNDQIRRAVNVELAKRDMNYSDLAEKLGMKRQYLSAILTGKVATLQKSWEKILGELDLDVMAVSEDNLAKHLEIEGMKADG